jgi:hypothetical protein
VDAPASSRAATSNRDSFPFSFFRVVSLSGPSEVPHRAYQSRAGSLERVRKADVLEVARRGLSEPRVPASPGAAEASVGTALRRQRTCSAWDLGTPEKLHGRIDCRGQGPGFVEKHPAQPLSRKAYARRLLEIKRSRAPRPSSTSGI